MKEVMVWLDRMGDADTPEGAAVVESEAGFLRCALEEPRLLVRGEWLCEWAGAFYRGRGLSLIETHSPIRALQRVIPGLTTEYARELLDYLGGERQITQEPGLTPRRVLETLYPEGRWSETPTRNHAAAWLRWLYLEQPTPAMQVTFAPLCEAWRNASIEPEHRLYEAIDHDAARALLGDWLGINPQPRVNDLGEFPEEIPTGLVHDARQAWRTHIIETEGAFFDDLARRLVPRRLLRVAAEETAEYLLQHREHLTQARFKLLAPLLDPARARELARYAPPPRPSWPPEATPELLHWFEAAYLPYRRWQTDYGQEDDAALATAIIRRFADWYLTHYPQALSGGPLREHLSFRQPLPHQPDGQASTLVVILDGLHAEDALHLRQKLEDRAPRLQLVETRWVFSTLPTVTEFAKPPVLTGLAPTAAVHHSTRAEVLPEREDPLKHLAPGKILFWRVMDPDRTYHGHNADASLLIAVEATLHRIATEIARIVRDVPADLPLRVVLTTDHGRLFDRVPRTIPIPPGMTAHGRAAWGARQHTFDASGLLVEGDVAFLHGERFGLPEEVGEVAVILGAHMFKTNDNKSGGEAYPHGGISPEEIIVPWWVLERDWKIPKIAVTIRGRSVAGRPGEANVKVINTGDVSMKLAWVELRRPKGAAQLIEVNLVIAPRSSAQLTIGIDPWPTPAEVGDLTAEAVFHLTSGKRFDVSVSLELDSEEMYSRDNILEDLV